VNDFSKYHLETLPALLAAGRSRLLAGQRLPPLGVRLVDEPDSFTYFTADDGLHVVAGLDQAKVWVELDARDWQGLVGDVETIPAIMYGNRIRNHQGDLMQFMRWEPALRALYTGRPIYEPDRFQLQGEDGRALDPLSAFTLNDALPDMREFLSAAGYLLLRGVFDAEELDAFRLASRELAATARQGDQDSWWGKSQSGEPILCRCLIAGTVAPFQTLYEDPRIDRLRKLLPADMMHPPPEARDGVTVVYKNPLVSEGLSDLPWHRDCGMGGHAIMCPSFVVSIYLYDATPEQGALQFLPGSQNYAFGFVDPNQAEIPGAITVPARAGDLTVHNGDVMHAAPSPLGTRGPFRQSALLSFHPPFDQHRGDRHYNDVLLGADDGQVVHLRDKVSDQ
jgi:hypothetical protein